MFAYVARQSIVNEQMQLVGYELLFRNGKNNCFPDIRPDEATSKLLASNHLSLGVEEITDGKLAFINFHEHTLLHEFPTFLDPDKVVVEIVETVPVTRALVSACKVIAEKGYALALDDFDFDPKWQALLPYVKIIKIDVQQWQDKDLSSRLETIEHLDVLLVAERIETHDQFLHYRELGFHLFQGYFFTKPQLMKQKSLSATKVVLLDLLEASCAEELDFDRINGIFERDVGLSYMLLRFINSPLINKGNRITSMRHALNYMGEVEIKKFIALIALANFAAEKPHQLVQMSLVRAKFCELISLAKSESDNPPRGFLVGMFSLLDALLDQNMPNLMNKLPLMDELKAALTGQQNALRDYLSLARAFEASDWANVKQLSAHLRLKQQHVHQLYNQAMKYGFEMGQAVK